MAIDSKEIISETTGNEFESSKICYSCGTPVSLPEILAVDAMFEHLDAWDYEELVDILGLRYCMGPPSVFHVIGGNGQGEHSGANCTNTCHRCFAQAIQILTLHEMLEGC